MHSIKCYIFNIYSFFFFLLKCKIKCLKYCRTNTKTNEPDISYNSYGTEKANNSTSSANKQSVWLHLSSVLEITVFRNRCTSVVVLTVCVRNRCTSVFLQFDCVYSDWARQKSCKPHRMFRSQDQKWFCLILSKSACCQKLSTDDWRVCVCVSQLSRGQ